MKPLEIGVTIVRGNLGRMLSRLPGGAVKVQWVRIVDDIDEAKQSIPSLWPPQEWFDGLIKSLRRNARRRDFRKPGNP